MKEAYDFITYLFEKSKLLNDLNTVFLKDIELGNLTNAQKLALFNKSTNYHEGILKLVSEVLKSVDKTPFLLPPDTQELVHLYDELDDFTRRRTLDVVRALQNTVFVPEHLSVCPECGGAMGLATTKRLCLRIPLKIGNQTIAWTYRCMSDKSKRDGRGIPRPEVDLEALEASVAHIPDEEHTIDYEALLESDEGYVDFTIKDKEEPWM